MLFHGKTAPTPVLPVLVDTYASPMATLVGTYASPMATLVGTYASPMATLAAPRAPAYRPSGWLTTSVRSF